MLFGTELTPFNIFILVFALIGGLGGVIYLSALFRQVSHIATELNKLTPLVPVITTIAKEFQTNGGASLRDDLDKMAAATTATNIAVAELKLGLTLLAEVVNSIRAHQKIENTVYNAQLAAGAQGTSIGEGFKQENVGVHPTPQDPLHHPALPEEQKADEPLADGDPHTSEAKFTQESSGSWVAPDMPKE